MAGDGDFRGRHASYAHAAHVPALVVLALGLVLSLAATASAAPLPVDGAVSVGLPPTRVHMHVEATDQGTRIRARAGAHGAEVTLPGVLAEADVERVALSGGASVALVRGRGEGGRVAALIVVRRGRPEISWTGRLDMRGDPGERTSDVLDVSDRTGDGVPDVVVGQAREGVGLCGEPAAMLYPRALDPASGALRPVVLRRVGAGEEVAVTATTESPGPTGAPVVRALRAVGASSALGVDEDARALGPPNALVDGREETYWAEGRGGAGDGELVSLRFGAGMPIRAVAITAARAESVRAPRALWIVGDAGPRLRVTLPERFEGRAWIVPPAPLAWSCFAVVLADPGGDAGARTGIAEIEAFTDVDFGAGMDALVSELVRDGEGGDRATQWLGRLGERAVVALDGAWERLGARGRVRAVRVASEVAGAGSEPALALLARAAADENEEVRAAALGALVERRAEGRIADLAALAGAAGEDAAARLERSERAFPIAPLLDAVRAEGGSERPRLRAALARGVALGGDAARGEIEAAELSVAARASLALGLAENEATRAAAAPLVERAAAEASTFADRWRTARAAAHVERSAGVEATMQTWAREAEEWMLRSAAVDALGAGSVDVLRERALSDAYPRVRIAAVEQLARHGALESATASAVARDRWPMVRVAVLDASVAAEGGRERARAALDDDAQLVRRRAIEHLTRLRDRGAWPAIEQRLRDTREWPMVIDAALAYVSELCVAGAGEALVEVIRRGAREGAWEPNVENAGLALRVLTRLGGAALEDGRTVAMRGGESLRAAVEASRTSTEETCAAGPE
ncbi:hypothetical protein [Sandaracinus amylolyticus]|nr:hypothetical protein [Sandaracinus amylolyticus]